MVRTRIDRGVGSLNDNVSVMVYLRGLLCLGAAVLAGCATGETSTPETDGGGGGGTDAASDSPNKPGTFTVGGSVTGLTGTGLVLQDNGGDDLSVSAAGSFTFKTALADGAA